MVVRSVCPSHCDFAECNVLTYGTTHAYRLVVGFARVARMGPRSHCQNYGPDLLHAHDPLAGGLGVPRLVNATSRGGTHVEAAPS